MRWRNKKPSMVAILLASTLVCACYEEEKTCQIPQGESLSYFFELGTPLDPPGSIDLTEEATVLSVGEANGKWTVRLETLSGETVSLTADLSQELRPGLQQGETVILMLLQEHVGVSGVVGWWQTSIELKDSQGTLLFSLRDTAYHTDRPGLCPPHEGMCGTYVYPSVLLSSGDQLYAGEASVFESNGSLYRTKVFDLWMIQKMTCGDYPSGWILSVTVKL